MSDDISVAILTFEPFQVLTDGEHQRKGGPRRLGIQSRWNTEIRRAGSHESQQHGLLGKGKYGIYLRDLVSERVMVGKFRCLSDGKFSLDVEFPLIKGIGEWNCDLFN